MADYDQVPRALRSLAQTARQVIPIRAEREATRARMGLERARTEFDIGRAKRTEAHRTRVFEAGEERTAATEEHRERVWEAGKEPRAVAAVKAKRERAGLERGEQYVTSGHFFGGSGVKDLLQIKDVYLPALKKGAGIEKVADPQPGGPTYTKDGEPYKLWQMEQDIPLLTQIFRAHTGGRHVLATIAENKEHPWHEKAMIMLAENDELGIA